MLSVAIGRPPEVSDTILFSLRFTCCLVSHLPIPTCLFIQILSLSSETTCFFSLYLSPAAWPCLTFASATHTPSAQFSALSLSPCPWTHPLSSPFAFPLRCPLFNLLPLFIILSHALYLARTHCYITHPVPLSALYVISLSFFPFGYTQCPHSFLLSSTLSVSPLTLCPCLPSTCSPYPLRSSSAPLLFHCSMLTLYLHAHPLFSHSSNALALIPYHPLILFSLADPIVNLSPSTISLLLPCSHPLSCRTLHRKCLQLLILQCNCTSRL